MEHDPNSQRPDFSTDSERTRSAPPGANADAAADDASGARAEGKEGGRSRVLHARISEELYEALSKAAAELRVPVSNLVRNALEDTFTLVDRMGVNVHHFVGRAMREAGEVGARLRQRRPWRPGTGTDPASGTTTDASGQPRSAEARADRFPDVIAWQPAILHSAQQCSSCGTHLDSGARAYSGLTAPASASAAAWLCRPCLWRLG